jgi:hypothetical protein
MTPTPRLRFVERKEVIGHDGRGTLVKTVRALQQWHAYDINYPTEKGEWKDVPLEKENV